MQHTHNTLSPPHVTYIYYFPKRPSVLHRTLAHNLTPSCQLDTEPEPFPCHAGGIEWQGRRRKSFPQCSPNRDTDPWLSHVLQTLLPLFLIGERAVQNFKINRRVRIT